MNSLKIGIVVADFDEYKTLEAAIINDKFEEYSFLGRKGHRFFVTTHGGTAEVISILCGIGKVNATAAAMHLADVGCSIILNYGLSGGVSGISKNEMCLCTNFLEHDFDLTGIGYKPCEKPAQKYIYEADKALCKLAKRVVPNAKCGTAVTGDRFICDSDVRDFLKNTFGAMSCDMETAAIAYVCEFSGIPYLSLRRISDDAGADAYESYAQMNISDDTVLSDYILLIIAEIINSQNKA